MSLFVAPLLAAIVLAAPVPVPAPAEPESSPKGVPLKLAITGKDATYPLDLGGKSPAEFRELLKQDKPGRKPLPPAPKVALTVTLTNTSTKPLSVWVSGDPVVLELKLTGDGAENVDALVAMTREFRFPKAVEIAPGESHSFPITSLSSGMRGMTKRSFWTTAGEHKLTASLRTGVSPAPKGSEVQDGFGV
ncbi:MAG: hypothetical protein ACRC7O_19535, partial [Fimbriiglobus sp.]